MSKIRSVVGFDDWEPVKNHSRARFAVERADGSVVALCRLILDCAKSHQIILGETYFLHVTSWIFRATVKLDERSQECHVTRLQAPGGQDLILNPETLVRIHFDVPGSSSAIFKVKPSVVVSAVLMEMSHFLERAYFLLLERGNDFSRRVGLLEMISPRETVLDQRFLDRINEAAKLYSPVTIRLR